MPFDYQLLSTVIRDVLLASGSASERMHRLIDECERQIPHADWNTMRQIDFEADIVRAKGWMQDSVASVKSKEHLRGFWFGLFNPVYDEDATADVYIAASTGFIEGSIDWAYDLSDLLVPVKFRSSALDSIYRRAYYVKNGLGNDAEYPLVLAYGSMLAMTALEGFDATMLASPSGAAVGFDSGDLFLLGKFFDGKFVPNVAIG